MKKVEIEPFEKGISLSITTSGMEYIYAFRAGNQDELEESMDELGCPSGYHEAVIKEFNK